MLLPFSPRMFGARDSTIFYDNKSLKSFRLFIFPARIDSRIVDEER